MLTTSIAPALEHRCHTPRAYDRRAKRRASAHTGRTGPAGLSAPRSLWAAAGRLTHGLRCTCAPHAPPQALRLCCTHLDRGRTLSLGSSHHTSAPASCFFRVGTEGLPSRRSTELERIVGSSFGASRSFVSDSPSNGLVLTQHCQTTACAPSVSSWRQRSAGNGVQAAECTQRSAGSGGCSGGCSGG